MIDANPVRMPLESMDVLGKDVSVILVEERMPDAFSPRMDEAVRVIEAIPVDDADDL